MTKPHSDLFRFYYNPPLNPKEVAKARHAAARHGWRVEKSRQRYQHHNNQGGLMVVNNENNIPIAGWDYDLLPEDVIQLCE
jgi:hypothetical protein